MSWIFEVNPEGAEEVGLDNGDLVKVHNDEGSLLGLISKVLGRDFPGHGSIAVSLSCRFLRPVPVGSEVRIEVTIVEKLEKYRHVRGRTRVYNDQNKIAIGGEATIIPPAGDDG